MSAALDRRPSKSRHHTVADPADVEDIIARLHIGSLRKEQLRARKSILVDDDTPPLSHHEAEALAKTETYSVTSEESYNDKRRRDRRKTSGSSKDSGIVDADSSPKISKLKAVKSKDQEVQTSIGKTYQYSRFHDENYAAAEEGAISHEKTNDDKKGHQHQQKGFKLSRLFKSSEKKSADNNNHLTLPQTFIVKYMGSRPSKGYGGAKYVQTPIEEVVENVNQLSKGSDLPLVRLEVTVDGLSMTPHKRNKVKSFESVAIPIQYISYGSQDQNYPRIFCFIMVREMSARSKKLDCHVYACDSSASARKVAGCLAMAFHIYQESMQGQPAQYSAQITKSVQYLDDDIKSSYDV